VLHLELELKHSLIEEGNEPLQTVLTALQSIVKGAFIEDVEQETQVVTTFYAALQQDSQDRKDTWGRVLYSYIRVTT
jgi:hypothetical protein